MPVGVERVGGEQEEFLLGNVGQDVPNGLIEDKFVRVFKKDGFISYFAD